MYHLRELIKIDQRFQNSVNLQLDISRKDKIESFISTHSTDRILEHYLANVKEGRENATILIGPYGKGKSHLLLVLLDRLRHQERPLLPVLVSGNYEDLNQAFLMGMQDALKREGAESAAPDSYYSKALERIAVWEKDYPNAYQMFQKAAADKGFTGKELKKQLTRLDKNALKVFQNIYPEITYGGSFTPLAEMETARLYEEMNRKLAEEYHYGGVFIIFDEFSKYLEGHAPDTFARDMKLIQDMCELANSSKDPQIHMALVAHKSIKEYGTAIPKEMVQAFTGVEGRLKEILFIVSSQNNYELMQRAIKKKSKLWEVAEGITPFKENATASYHLECFRALFEEKDFSQIILKGCYPMMPLTAYLLLHISEKAAQNERSIFTYLANDEKGTLYRHIRAVGHKTEEWAVAADTIYDYFENIFREDVALTGIHAEWLKADYALAKTGNITEQRVIKVIALLWMIHKPEEVIADARTIRLALNLREDVCKTTLEELEKKQIIRWKARNRCYIFWNNVGVDIEKEIREVEAKLPANVGIAQELGRVFEQDYILPKLHNQEFTISRFFAYVFMTLEQFFKLPDTAVLFEEHFADGKLLAILKDDAVIEADIQRKLMSLSDSRIVVILPELEFHQQKNVKKLLALEKLLNDRAFIENNPVIYQELANYKEDVAYEINQSLCRDYDPSRGKCQVFYQNDVYQNGCMQNLTFNSFISKICTEFYGQGPKINNELINRQHISAQNKKARKKIISMILSDEDCSSYEKGTGPEATIYRAVLLRTGVRGNAVKMEPGCRLVLEEMAAFITTCDGQKISFARLYKRLMGKNYGIRRGILPIYLANQFVKLSDIPVLYLDEKEVCIDADAFENINRNPADYYLYVEHKTVMKEQYLSSLEQLFPVKEETGKTSGQRTRFERVLEGMQRWYRSLPQITLNFNRRPQEMAEEQMEEIRSFRKMFRQMEMNPREALFERLPLIFSEENFLRLFQRIQCSKEYLDQYLESIRQRGINSLKEEFVGKKTESLSACLSHWCALKGEGAQAYLSNNRVTNFMQYIAELNTYDETEVFGYISKIILDLYVEDWTDETFEMFLDIISKTRQEIELMFEPPYGTAGKNHIQFTGSGGENISKYYDSMEADSTSYFLKNAIEDALEEFGDSLEINQKVSVLIQALEQLIQH